MMISKYHRLFDPLDVELLERAFDGNWAVVEDAHLDGDEELETMLHRELIEIAAFNGANDLQSVRDILNAATTRLASLLGSRGNVSPDSAGRGLLTELRCSQVRRVETL